VEAPLSPQELIRPWRTATLVASLLAAVELVLLLGVGAVLLAKPLSRMLAGRSHGSARTAPAHHAKTTPPPPAVKVAKRHVPHARPHLSRAQTSVLVLNGNGRQGAAGATASTLSGLGYRITSTGNARRQDYAASVVLYRPGYQAEGMRLARDLRIQVTGPLDGLPVSRLDGGQLAVIVGA
jgi:hypothetical protein